MSMPTALRRALLALGVAGSLVPGLSPPPAPAGPGPLPSVAPAAAPVATVTPAAPRDLDALRRTWTWPLRPRPAVTSPFVPPRSTYGAGHRGMDLAARPRQEVLAVAAGVVTHVGVVAGRGTVSLTHASGLRSTYEPVRGAVSTGTAVSKGQVVGVVEGRTHCGGECLHLGALRGTGYVDPRPLLGGGPVILLPLGPRR